MPDGDPGRPYPTFALAFTLFDGPHWDALSAERPLRYWRLIEINQPGVTPLTMSALRADERIVNYLKGLNQLDDRLTSFVAPFDVPGNMEQGLAALHEAIAEAIEHRLRHLSVADRLPVIQLTEAAQKVAQGHLGAKSGQGFYSFANDRPVIPEKTKGETPQTRDVAERLMLRLLNEAVACRREKVTVDDDLLDAGVIFGTGFAPFRGGPLHHILSEGVMAVYGRLKSLEVRYGSRFAPDEGWRELLETEKGSA